VFQSIGQLPDRIGKLALKFSTRHVIHSGSLVVYRNLLERGQKIPFRKHFVKQSESLSPFHSRHESRQHARCPDARVGAPP
jgi:hypothetical protein